MDKDPWSYLGDGLKQSTDPAIQGTVGSAYKFLMTVGTLGVLVTLVIVGVKIAMAPPAKRADAFSELFWKAVIAIILFSMTAIIPWLLRAADSIA